MGGTVRTFTSCSGTRSTNSCLRSRIELLHRKDHLSNGICHQAALQFSRTDNINPFKLFANLCRDHRRGKQPACICTGIPVKDPFRRDPCFSRTVNDDIHLRTFRPLQFQEAILTTILKVTMAIQVIRKSMIMIEKGMRKNLLIRKKVTILINPQKDTPCKNCQTTLRASDVLV